MKKINKLSIITLLIYLLGSANVLHALPLLFPIESVFDAIPIYYTSGGSFAFDEADGKFWSIKPYSSGSGILPSGDPTGIIGEVNYTAYVDSNGKVLSGSFNFFGTIPQLGIDTPTTLAFGRITDISIFNLTDYINWGYVIDPMLQMLIELDSSEEALGLGRLIGFQALAGPGSAGPIVDEWLKTPFNVGSYVGYHTSFQDIINVQVPEPSTLLLTGFGLAIGALVIRKKLKIR